MMETFLSWFGLALHSRLVDARRRIEVVEEDRDRAVHRAMCAEVEAAGAREWADPVMNAHKRLVSMSEFEVAS